jgi:hypothetical protein
MNPEQRQLAWDLVITPPSGTRKISKEEFVRRFPAAIRGGSLSVDIIDQAVRDRSAKDLVCAMIIGHSFGFSSGHEEILCRLAFEDWHWSHESIVGALELGEFKDERCIDALYHLTQFVPPYLEFDDARALAIKAIWALGRIPGHSSQAKLEALAQSSSPRLKQVAEEQLNRRGSR